MPIEEIANSPIDLASEVAITVGSIGKWLQAIGIIIILWLIIQIINWFYNRKKTKNLYALNERMERIEKKLDRVLKKK